jgi:hypothetical protein
MPLGSYSPHHARAEAGAGLAVVVPGPFVGYHADSRSQSAIAMPCIILASAGPGKSVADCTTHGPRHLRVQRGARMTLSSESVRIKKIWVCCSSMSHTICRLESTGQYSIGVFATWDERPPIRVVPPQGSEPTEQELGRLADAIISGVGPASPATTQQYVDYLGRKPRPLGVFAGVGGCRIV